MKRLMAAGAALALTTGCAAGVGAGAGAALVAVGILTYECYDYVTITVIDGATGAKTCAAKVTASEGGGVDELGSCYHAPPHPRALDAARRAAGATSGHHDRRRDGP